MSDSQDKWWDDNEEEIVAIAREEFSDAFDLAVETHNEEAFYNILTAANKILLDRTLTTLVEKGLVDLAGIDETGDFLFGLTEEGRKVADSYPRDIDYESYN